MGSGDHRILGNQEISLVEVGHTRLSCRVMSVCRTGLRVTGDTRGEVERRTGRNKALPERIDMMEVWIGLRSLDLEAVRVR
jgi:hypothetical protein